MKSVKSANALVTSKEATIKGFSWQANEKVSRADAFISHADYFIKKAGSIKSIADVRKDQVLTEKVCMEKAKAFSIHTRIS